MSLIKFALSSPLAFSIVFASAVALAQTEQRPPDPATDEYGIPLKLESPTKVSPEAAMSGQLSGKKTSSPASKPKTDEYGMPISKTATRRSRAPSRASTANNGGASGKLIRSPVRPQKSNSPAPQVVAPEVLENQATKELILPPTDLSNGVLPTPATVRSRVDEVKNPVHPLTYRAGVSLQPFTPKGTMGVGNLVPYDLAQAGTAAMVALDGQWLPFKISRVPGLQAGLFGSVGYSQLSLSLRSPSGFALDDTRLHILKFQVGGTASYQLPRSPLWSLHGNLGVGRLMEIQASQTSYANESATVDFGSLGVAVERSLLDLSWANLSVYAGYDFRLALSRSTAGADVPNHNVLLGFLGNFE